MAIKTVREAVNLGIRESMLAHDNVMLMGCDVGLRGNPFAITKGLLNEFGPRRVYDTPIAEAGFTGLAIGAAIAGCRPIVEILYNDWITLPMDQIVNTAAKSRYMFGGEVDVPLVVRTPFGLGGGTAAQHNQCWEAWFYHVPGLKVLAPAAPEDVKGLLMSAVEDDNPVIIFEHKRMYQVKGEIPDGDYRTPIGKAKIIREGSDCTIVTYSNMCYKAMDAAEELAKEGIDVEVVDLRSLLPLDWDTVMNSIAKTNRLVVAHEAGIRGGIGGDIVARVCELGFDLLDAPPARVGGPMVPCPYNSGLEAAVMVGQEQIIEAVHSTLE